MKKCLFFAVIILVAVIGPDSTLALDTGTMGGVPNPSLAEMQTMDASSYIYHAKDGVRTNVIVDKILLEHDISQGSQGHSTRRDPVTGDIYVRGGSKTHKSTDGGLTWTWFHNGSGIPDPWAWQILSDGTFVGISTGGYSQNNATVRISIDHGGTWTDIGTIVRPTSFDFGGGTNPYDHWDPVTNMYRVPGSDTLIWPVGFRDDSAGLNWDTVALAKYRSTDGGSTWTGPTLFTTETYNYSAPLPHPLSEGGIARLPSGKLLAALRYQRPLYPEDPPGTNLGGYKNVFLLDSDDDGVTWTNLRQLTTAYGQTYGYPAILSNGVVVVIHDTRYGPGTPGARAMISYDGGETWEDEVYYLDFSVITGAYTQSVVLEDDTIVTLSATCDAGNSGAECYDNTDLHAIRWKPVLDPNRMTGSSKRADFDENGGVDFRDFATLALAWQSQEGDGNWNQDCDIFYPVDQVIDNNDLGTFEYFWLRIEPFQVAIVDPCEGQEFIKADITEIVITADVTVDHDESVVQVDFYADEDGLIENLWIGVDTDGSDGFSFSWTEYEDRYYSLTAVATDNDASTATSDPVRIKVIGGPPPR